MTGGPLFEAAGAEWSSLPPGDARRSFDIHLLGALLTILDTAADPELDRMTAIAIASAARFARERGGVAS